MFTYGEIIKRLDGKKVLRHFVLPYLVMMGLGSFLISWEISVFLFSTLFMGHLYRVLSQFKLSLEDCYIRFEYMEKLLAQPTFRLKNERVSILRHQQGERITYYAKFAGENAYSFSVTYDKTLNMFVSEDASSFLFQEDEKRTYAILDVLKEKVTEKEHGMEKRMEKKIILSH